MSNMKVRSLLRWFIMLSIIRKKKGTVMLGCTRRSIKRLSAFNVLKNEYLRYQKVLRLSRRRKQRRWHVRPLFMLRKLFGAWHSTIPFMREEDPDEYFNFMRMTPESFDDLLEKVSPFVSKTSWRESISAGERLAVTLRYLASGDSMASLSHSFLISSQAISKIIFETTAAIWYVMKDEVFEPLGGDFWRRKGAEFEAMWNFPMCVGAIDGKHCFVQKFPMRGSEHFNYKYGNSVILLAVSDAKYKFIVVDVGGRGRESDGGVFQRSEFGQLFINHQLQLPPPVYNQDLKSELPFVFLGDDAFTFDTHLMKPFESTSGPEEVVFNYRLSRARRVVENAFGILSARFRVLRKNIIGSETLVQNIILACTALHNLHLLREDSIPPRHRVYLPPGYADTYKSNGKLKSGRWRNESKHTESSIFHKLIQQENVHANLESASEVREKFMELFIMRSLPWQYDELPDV